jgi:CubicO group peptidase (beta-lactamase class C family)
MTSQAFVHGAGTARFAFVFALASLASLGLEAADGVAARIPDRAELAAFADREVPALLQKHHVVGMVVAFVEDGGLVFARGYGMRDRERGLPFDAERTLFRAGSISKLFVWTAVMQCEEQGLVDLDADVDRYLGGVPIPATFPQPITLRHLMDHTPGFEDQVVGLFETDPARVRTLEQAIRHVPKRIAPPGRMVAYSNYGAALAAYVVERVTGTPFERYARERILAPLGMTRSTFAQPPPADLAPDLSVGYSGGARPEPRGFEYISGLYPAGALSTTATDLARFLLAHLGRGALGGRRILGEAAADRMHTLSFSYAPGFSGTAYGFMAMPTGAGTMLYHGGDTMLFHSFAGILPDRRFGFLVSANSMDGGEASYEFAESVLSRFFPGKPGRERADAWKTPEDPQRFAGVFLTDRRSESDMGRLMMLGMQVRATAAPAGGLLVSSFMHPEPVRYLQVGHDLFQAEDGEAQLLFLEDARGAVRSAVLGQMPIMTFSRPAFADQPLVTVAVGSVGLLVLVTGLVFPPTGLLALRWRTDPRDREARSAAWVGRALIASYVAYVVTLAVAFSDPVEVLATTPAKQVAPFIPYLGLGLGLAAAWCAVRVWRRGSWGWRRRVHYAAVVLGTGALFCLLVHWKAVG